MYMYNLLLYIHRSVVWMKDIQFSLSLSIQSPSLTQPTVVAASTTVAAAPTGKLSRDRMGEPQVKFGDSEVFLFHLDSKKLVGCPVSERSRLLLSGQQGKRKVLMQRDSHQRLSFTVTRASEEQAKAAGVVQLMEKTMRNFVQK